MSSPIIAIQDLQFSWPGGQFELSVPELEIAEHTSTLVTGPSGSGKTTLLNILAGIWLPSVGVVRTMGTPLTELPDRERRAFRLRNIGMVFQSFELLDYLNVVDNVLLPARISSVVRLTPALRQRAKDLLADVGLSDFATRPVSCLSQGERQRVAICRALLTNPSLLLADEPTGNLDPSSKEKIVQLLLDQVSDHHSTLLMVSHDHSLVTRFANHVDFDSLQQAAESAPGDSGAA